MSSKSSKNIQFTRPKKAGRVHKQTGPSDYRKKARTKKGGPKDDAPKDGAPKDGVNGVADDLPDYVDSDAEDDEVDERDFYSTDTTPDDPDVLGGDPSKDRPTLGIELEFMLAACSNPREHRVIPNSDPHPGDLRWCSSKLGDIDWPKHNPVSDDSITDEYSNNLERLGATCRSKLARILRAKGLTVVKPPDYKVASSEYNMRHVEPNHFSETDDTDDELEEDYANKSFLGDFDPAPVTWDPAKDEPNNIKSATSHFVSEFISFHLGHNLSLYRTRRDDVWDQVAKLRMEGASWDNYSTASVRCQWVEKMATMVWEEKRRNERKRNRMTDPMHVPVPGMERRYRAWTITADCSVDGNGMTASRYNIPPGRAGEEPMEEYRYFGAEVVSPVLDAGAESTYQVIRTACGALRDELRIHKPMILSTGFHVHLGHQAGWNLRQLKRLATLWYLTEDQLLLMHRKDRGTDKKWCAKIGGGTRLWAGLFSPDEETWRLCSRWLPQTRDRARELYEEAMLEHVPYHLLSDEQATVVGQLWQLPTVTDLQRALSGYPSPELGGFPIRTGLRWRVTGRKRTDDSSGGTPQTVEARVMQGTLDADHINAWIAVLCRLADASRNWTPAAFRALLLDHLSHRPRPQLMHLLHALGVPRPVRGYWVADGRRSRGRQWWEYPDKDRVDWDRPFMVRGHRATHGRDWDDLPF